MKKRRLALLFDAPASLESNLNFTFAFLRWTFALTLGCIVMELVS